jgi:hypothetical protein
MVRLAILFWAGLFLGSAAHADERAKQLVNSFMVMCTLEPIDLARSDQKATAMQLPVRKNVNPPADQNGYFARAKTWLLPLKSGPHEFTVAEARGPSGDIKSCGIGAPDVNAAEFRNELIKVMALGKPSNENISADRNFRQSVWELNDLNLVLADGSPRGLSQGIYLLIATKPLTR